ncbi:tetratricopeptide repeat protein, partial [Staphylococcus pasteuri_A]
FKDCLRTEPEFSLARFQLALSLLATGQTEDGAVELKELTSATPEYLINFAKGILFSLDNKKDEAIEQLKLGISINNENP